MKAKHFVDSTVRRLAQNSRFINTTNGILNSGTVILDNVEASASGYRVNSSFVVSALLLYYHHYYYI